MSIIKDAGILRILFVRITFIHYEYSVPTTYYIRYGLNFSLSFEKVTIRYALLFE